MILSGTFCVIAGSQGNDAKNDIWALMLSNSLKTISVSPPVAHSVDGFKPMALADVIVPWSRVWSWSCCGIMVLGNASTWPNSAIFFCI